MTLFAPWILAALSGLALALAMPGPSLGPLAFLFPALLLEALHRGGRYVTAGAIAGPIVKLDVRTLYLKDLELIGSTVPTPEIFPALLRYIERQEIQPLLAKAYPLAEIRQAQQDFLDKKFVGKLVLTPPAEG